MEQSRQHTNLSVNLKPETSLKKSISSISNELQAVGTGDYFVNFENKEQKLSFIKEQTASAMKKRQLARHARKGGD